MSGINNFSIFQKLALKFKIVQNFHYLIVNFCKSRLSNFHQKFNFPKIVSSKFKIVQNFHFFVSGIEFPKNSFLAQFKIVQNFPKIL